MADFPSRLTAIRTRRKLTIPELAAACGLSRQSIHQLENGERAPSWDTVTKLAKALKVKTDAFQA